MGGKVRLFRGSISSDVFGFPVLAKGAYVKGYVQNENAPLTCVVIETHKGETIEESIVVQCYGKSQPVTLNRIISLANVGDTVAFVLPNFPIDKPRKDAPSWPNSHWDETCCCKQ